MALDVAGPVEIPSQVTAIVDRVLDDHAKTSGWEPVHWYHDEPIWFLEKRDGDIVRRVQIAPFRVKQDGSWIVALRLIPSAYRTEDGRVRQRAAKVPAAQIQSIPLPSEPDVFEKVLSRSIEHLLDLASSLNP